MRLGFGFWFCGGDEEKGQMGKLLPVSCELCGRACNVVQARLFNWGEGETT